jgi:hypothetical protein
VTANGSDIRTYYSQPTSFTALSGASPALDSLPAALDELVRVVQGLAIYDVIAGDFYGFDVPDDRAGEIHIRRARELVDRLLEIDDQRLTVARPPERRLVGRCHHFTLLLVAMLRHHGVAARARCGLADYFNPGYYEDHWVSEYWDAAEGQWRLVDAQLDEVWREKLEVDFDILDVPRDRFLVAGEAWARCRSGRADPSRFGIHHAGLRGLWFVAGDLVRDIAALNKDELLPWDVWGAQPRPDEPLDEPQLDFFDRLADLSRDPDAQFRDVRGVYQRDDRVRVPDTVLNALLDRLEPAR